MAIIMQLFYDIQKNVIGVKKKKKKEERGHVSKCFPKLLDEKNYQKFSLMIQIPRPQPIPCRTVVWGAICLPSTFHYSFHQGSFRNTVLRTALYSGQLSCGPEQTLPPANPRSHVHKNGSEQRLCTKLQASLLLLVLSSECLDLPKQARMPTTREPIALGLVVAS